MQDVYVKCFYKEPIFWETAVAPGTMNEERVHIWKIQMTADDNEPTEWTRLLDLKEKEKYNRFYKNDDKKRFAMARSVLKILLSQYLHQPVGSIDIKEGVNKKPFILNAGKEELYFNVSHSGTCILIAVSKYEVGIDVEFVSEHAGHDDIMMSAFSKEEAAFVKQAIGPGKAFYTLWTRKEALLKGTGKGLSDNLSAVPSLEGTHVVSGGIIDSQSAWQVCSFEIENECMASAAYNSNIGEVRFFELDAAAQLTGL